MLVLIAVLLGLQDPAGEKKVQEFLAGDAAARAELLKIGPPAIRPLLRERHRSFENVDLLLKDIKVAAAYPRAVPEPKKFDGTIGISLNLGKSTDLHSMVPWFHRYGFPVFSDSFDPDRLTTSQIKAMNATSPLALAEEICKQSGLDYGYFHNMLVIGLPERLWPGRPVPKPPDLDEAALKRARVLLEELGDEDIEVREAATRALTAMGPAIIPHLERHRERKEKEIAGRCVAIIKALSKPREGVFGPAAVYRKKLSEKDAEWLKELERIQDGWNYAGATLDKISADFEKTLGVQLVMPASLAQVKVSIQTLDQSLIDFLSLVTQSRDLDFIIRDRKIIIDSFDAIERMR